jgi:hypothetical protein
MPRQPVGCAELAAAVIANVVREYEANRQSLTEELAAHVSKLSHSIARVSSVAKILFPDRRIGFLEWSELNLRNAFWA